MFILYNYIYMILFFSVFFSTFSFYLCGNLFFQFNIYIYQLVTRLYKQSFIDYRIGSCDILLVDNFLRKPLIEAYYRNPVSERPMKTLSCPLKPVSSLVHKLLHKTY